MQMNAQQRPSSLVSDRPAYANTAPKAEALPCILFVDDEPSVLKALARFSRAKPWRVLLEQNPENVMALLERETVDIIVSDMRMPQMSGDELLFSVKNSHPHILRILLTGQADIQSLENAINNAGIYNYISKPWDDNLMEEVLSGALRLQKSERDRLRLEELTKRQNRQLGRLALSLDKTVKERTIEIEQALTLLKIEHQRLKDATHSTLDIITHLLEWNEGRANNHCRFVSEYAHKVAKALDLSEQDCDLAKTAGSLHDVGLMALPEELRRKPVFAMNEKELADYHQHPLLSEIALSASAHLEKVAKIVRSHHEYLDGTGFPEKLFAKDIDKVTRIISVVADYHDLYHGMLEPKILGHSDAKAYLKRHSGYKYDSKVVDTFLELIANFVEPISRSCASALQVKPGMVLEEDLHGANHLLLLTRGTVITQNMIERMISYEKKFGCKFELIVSG